MSNQNEFSANRLSNFTTDMTVTSGFAGLAAAVNAIANRWRMTPLEAYEFLRDLYNSGVISGTVTTSGGTITAASFTGS